jgi:hypothetical protein
VITFGLVLFGIVSSATPSTEGGYGGDVPLQDCLLATPNAVGAADGEEQRVDVKSVRKSSPKVKSRSQVNQFSRKKK